MLDAIRFVTCHLGGKACRWTRGDFANDPVHHDECWRFEQVAALLGGEPNLIGVGAFLGGRSSRALTLAAQAGKTPRLVAFEPSSGFDRNSRLLAKGLARPRTCAPSP